MEKVSYFIGYRLGSQFKASDLKIDLSAYIKGIQDGMGGKTPILPEEEARRVMTDFQKEMQAKGEKAMKEMAKKNKAEAEKFLKENAMQEGVKTLKSGIQYKVIKEGTGKNPKPGSMVKVNYVGRFINGQEFDNSSKANNGKPIEIDLQGVIPGWQEVIPLMKEGSKWEVYIPPHLAYGEGDQRMPPNSLLIFEIELVQAMPDVTPAPSPSEKK